MLRIAVDVLALMPVRELDNTLKITTLYPDGTAVVKARKKAGDTIEQDTEGLRQRRAIRIQRGNLQGGGEGQHRHQGQYGHSNSQHPSLHHQKTALVQISPEGAGLVGAGPARERVALCERARPACMVSRQVLRRRLVGVEGPKGHLT